MEVKITIAILALVFASILIYANTDDRYIASWAIFLFVLVIMFAIATSVTETKKTVSSDYYKMGQIDAMNGNLKFHLVKQPSGEYIFEEVK